MSVSIRPFVCIKKENLENYWGGPGPPGLPDCYGTV